MAVANCCSDSSCPSSEPSTTVNIYHLQFNVTYRVLEPNTTVVPVKPYMMDAVNGSIDVRKQAALGYCAVWVTSILVVNAFG
ncbi:hypothetical protein WJX79_005611 [Trebouxia sp. C0005]